MQTNSYKVFKGLQKPLEFMGLKGRYVWVGLGAAIATILTRAKYMAEESPG